MRLEKWTTLRTEHIQLLAQELAKQQIPLIAQLDPIADFEELLTFSEANRTPVEFTPQHPAWRLESVAARVIEADRSCCARTADRVGIPRTRAYPVRTCRLSLRLSGWRTPSET